MQGVIIHAPKDLRIEPVEVRKPGAGEVRVAIMAGGICGSDLHYYNHGGTATIRLHEPMALGHEVAGIVAEVGEGVTNLSVGTRVAVNPSQPCGHCEYCATGMQNHCIDMHFIGSAMRVPHDQGGFRQSLTMRCEQMFPIADSVTFAEAAMAEPLAVCLHAAGIAGPLLGKTVLITGSGPIGVLSAICARLGGAREIVITDLHDFPLRIAGQCGATRTINLKTEPNAMHAYAEGKGHFDVHFEASGNQLALQQALPTIRPRGILVQLGLGGEFLIPINALITREIQMLGSFRFDADFALAVDLLNSGRIDVRPLITATLPFENADRAFENANDRSSAMKMQLSFS